jgi:hypothetical protein
VTETVGDCPVTVTDPVFGTIELFSEGDKPVMVSDPTPAVTNWLLVAVTAGAIPVIVIAPTFGVTT